MPDNELFLGIDSSTQSLSGTVIDAGLKVLKQFKVNFDAELPEFKTRGGANRHEDGLTVTAPPIMWVAAMDILLKQMKESGIDIASIVAVSGSGQQHGSVYLNSSAKAALRNLRSGQPLREQLKDIFALNDSPIWMDSSTGKQCRDLEVSLGGAQAVANLTGSRAYERFTGNQIAKVSQTNPRAYDESVRIALVSSFMASILIGEFAPIDYSDGSGMNLMDLRSRRWAVSALNATAPKLKDRLGDIAPSHSVAGRIHKYYCETWGFAPNCMIITFSGDNPCSLAGLRLQKPGDIAISLGTSDTVFGSLSNPTPSATEGHMFANPVDPDGYMAMICYKNGSLTREDVRDRVTGGTWKAFADAMKRSPVGNDGRIGFFIKEPEITPPILKTGVFCFDHNGTAVKSLPAEAEARAVIEGQFLSMRLHGANVGLRPASILATGGASVDKSLIRVMCDVFGVPVFIGEVSGSATLGAAYRAVHGWKCATAGKFIPFADCMRSAPPFNKAADPDPAAARIYTAMLSRYAELEKRITNIQSK